MKSDGNLDKAVQLINEYLHANLPFLGGCLLNTRITVDTSDYVDLTADQVHRLMYKHQKCKPSWACVSEVLQHEGDDD